MNRYIIIVLLFAASPCHAATGIDFTRSFVSYIEDVTKTGVDDHCRASLIAHINIRQKNGKTEDYYLAAIGFSQDTFGHLKSGHIFTLPSYQFVMIAGSKDTLFLRTGDADPSSTMASSHHIDSKTILRTLKLRPLTNIPAIIKAAQDFLPIQAQVRYQQGESEITVDFPVRFMNSSALQGHFQVNTGPILIPSSPSPEIDHISSLARAFIGFNTLESVDLLSETMKNSSSYRNRTTIKTTQITLYTPQ